MGNCAVFPKAQPTHEISVCRLPVYLASKLRASEGLGMWLGARALAQHPGILEAPGCTASTGGGSGARRVEIGRHHNGPSYDSKALLPF